MPFILKFAPGVSKRVKNKAKKILAELGSLINEPIKVFVQNDGFVMNDGIKCWGYINIVDSHCLYKKFDGLIDFTPPEFIKFIKNCKYKCPEIHLAGKVRLEEFTTTLLHEFVHYEQFINCKKMQERGVSLRVKGLKKKLKL